MEHLYELPTADAKWPETFWRASTVDSKPYRFNYPELQKLKTAINKKKNRIDKTQKSQTTRKLYEHTTKTAYRFDDLRLNSQLTKKFGAEVASNAWLKMFELSSQFIIPTLETKITKTKGGADRKTTQHDLYSFHVAEAPGTFMLSINHTIRTNYPSVNWQWFANTYRPTNIKIKAKTGEYLSDDYGLLKEFQSKWLYGADNNGDITSTANLRSFCHTIYENMPRLDLVTGDGKGPITNYDEEELQLYALNLAQAMAGMHTMSKGGNLIIKTFSYYEGASMGLLYALACTFEKLYITKPDTSRSVNSETYIVATGYKRNLTLTQRQSIFEMLDYLGQTDLEDFASLNTSLFQESDIPKPFVDAVVEAMTTLTNRQSGELDRVWKYYEAIVQKNMSPEKLESECAPVRKKTAEEWIKKWNIKPLKPEYRMSQRGKK